MRLSMTPDRSPVYEHCKERFRASPMEITPTKTHSTPISPSASYSLSSLQTQENDSRCVTGPFLLYCICTPTMAFPVDLSRTLKPAVHKGITLIKFSQSQRYISHPQTTRLSNLSIYDKAKRCLRQERRPHLSSL